MHWNEEGPETGRTCQERLRCYEGLRLRKVLWEWTKIWTVTGRVITQQDRPLVMCTIHIRLITVSPLLLSCCPSASSLRFSPTSAQMINPASKGARISRFQFFRSSLTLHVRPQKSGVVTHEGRVGRSVIHQWWMEKWDFLVGCSGWRDHDLIPDGWGINGWMTGSPVSTWGQHSSSTDNWILLLICAPLFLCVNILV